MSLKRYGVAFVEVVVWHLSTLENVDICPPLEVNQFSIFLADGAKLDFKSENYEWASRNCYSITKGVRASGESTARAWYNLRGYI
jgi:hypothetical protein